MVVNTNWSNPATPIGSGGLDFATSDTITETVLDRYASDINRLGGTDGDTKTGVLKMGTTTAANNTVGVIINGSSNEYLTLRDDASVAHGITTQTETGCFMAIDKSVAANGGVRIRGLSEDFQGIMLYGMVTNDNTTHTTAGRAMVEVVGAKKSGTGLTAPGANANIFAVIDGGGPTAKFIIDEEGDMFNDGASGTSTTFDTEDDAALLETLTTWMNPQRESNYKYRLAHDLEAHKAALARGGVVTLNEDGSLSMLSYKGVLGLLIDGIRQLAWRQRELERRYDGQLHD